MGKFLRKDFPKKIYRFSKFSSVIKLQEKTEDLVERMEKLSLAEYVEMLRDPKRLFWINFWAGTARGLGMAVGFTILGAVLIYFLKHLVLWNLPLISDFIAEIIKMVQERNF